MSEVPLYVSGTGMQGLLKNQEALLLGFLGRELCLRKAYRGTSLIRNNLPLGPYSRTIPRPVSLSETSHSIDGQKGWDTLRGSQVLGHAYCRTLGRRVSFFASNPCAGFGITRTFLRRC